jgi:hypothetical protein
MSDLVKPGPRIHNALAHIRRQGDLPEAYGTLFLHTDEQRIGAIAQAMSGAEWVLEEQSVWANGDVKRHGDGYLRKERSPDLDPGSGSCSRWFT